MIFFFFFFAFCLCLQVHIIYDLCHFPCLRFLPMIPGLPPLYVGVGFEQKAGDGGTPQP